ncbi:hypothetical protein FKW77_007234 [Venturia effusa]|uniref:Autophagy-related protein 1 n=1 Tax=Venturia effusa TaxID=50376 RepID=A0A517LJC4_9PEZI|nr:hypothetical protein FKW77_007234 [Venturia effusa]
MAMDFRQTRIEGSKELSGDSLPLGVESTRILVFKSGDYFHEGENRWLEGKSIGEGGFGVVRKWECVHGPQKSSVRAFKQIHLDQEARRRRDWIRELEALGEFSNARSKVSFVEFYGWFEFEDRIGILMEYCEHGDLRNCSGAKPLPESDACQIVLQILNGLEMLHEAAFAHRDLKPANILVKARPPDHPRWHVKISDFGLSKRLQSVSAHSGVGGTLEYMAPELWRAFNHGQLRPSTFNALWAQKAADMWSVGLITEELLTAKRPRDRVHQDIRVYLAGHDLGPGPIAFVEALLKPEPRDRPTAAEAIRHKWVVELSVSVPCVERERGDERCSDDPLDTRSTRTGGAAAFVHRSRPFADSSESNTGVHHDTRASRRSVVDTTTGQHRFNGAPYGFSEDEKFVVLCRQDQAFEFVMWNTETNCKRELQKLTARPAATWSQCNPRCFGAFSPDNMFFALHVNGEKTLTIWSVLTGKIVNTIKPTEEKLAWCFSPLTRDLLFCSSDHYSNSSQLEEKRKTESNVVHVSRYTNTAGGIEYLNSTRIQYDGGRICYSPSICFSQDCDLVAIVYEKGERKDSCDVKVFDVESGNVRCALQGRPGFKSISPCPSGTFIMSYDREEPETVDLEAEKLLPIKSRVWFWHLGSGVYGTTDTFTQDLNICDQYSQIANKIPLSRKQSWQWGSKPQKHAKVVSWSQDGSKVAIQCGCASAGDNASKEGGLRIEIWDVSAKLHLPC